MNAVDFNGDTALHDAARFGHIAVCKLLLECGSDATIVNKEGKNVAQVAADYKKADVIGLL